MDASREVRLFLLLAGDTGVGKTSLAQRLAWHGRHDANEDDTPAPDAPPPRPTIGIAYEHATWRVDGTDVVLYMIDAAGNTQFAPLLPNQYRLAHGVLLLYDVTDRESFEHARTRWLPEIQRHAPDDTVLALVGNKMDRLAATPGRRAVSAVEARVLGEDMGAVGVYECAARAWRLAQLVTPVEALLPAMIRCYHARRQAAIDSGMRTLTLRAVKPQEEHMACCS